MADDFSFSVMTFNLRFGLADDGDNAWKYRKKAFPFLFRRYQPDFIGFQEANNFQTEYLAALLDRYDFNCSLREAAHAVFTQNGFEDAFAGTHTSTFHGFTGHNLGGHIDWILSRDGLKVLGKEIIRDQFAGFYPSDHFPVLVEFAFAPAP